MLIIRNWTRRFSTFRCNLGGLGYVNSSHLLYFCFQYENNDSHISKFHLPILANYFLNIDVGFINLEKSLWYITTNFMYITCVGNHVFIRYNRGQNNFILVHLRMWHTIIYVMHVENGQIILCYLLSNRNLNSCRTRYVGKFVLFLHHTHDR